MQNGKRSPKYKGKDRCSVCNVLGHKAVSHQGHAPVHNKKVKVFIVVDTETGEVVARF